MSSSKNNLAICELIHPKIHGTAIESCGHYMIQWFISIDEFQNCITSRMIRLMKQKWWERTTSPPHPFIRAFWRIIAQPQYFTLQIVEDKELYSGETIAIVKTVWLRIFQRKCRNILNERKLAREKIKHLRYRSIHGKWPS